MLPPGYSFVEVDEDNGEIRRKPRRGKKGGLQRSQSAHAGLGGRGRGRGGDDDDGFQGQTAGSTAAQKKRDSLSRVDSKSYQRYREANSIRRGPGPDENASRGLITSIADPPPPRVGVPSGGGSPGPGSGGGRAHGPTTTCSLRDERTPCRGWRGRARSPTTSWHSGCSTKRTWRRRSTTMRARPLPYRGPAAAVVAVRDRIRVYGRRVPGTTW